MAELTKVHLGCGSNMMPGWINCDIERNLPGVKFVDLRERLPFADGSVDFIFCEHVIEHLTLKDGHHMLAEAMRILKPGGVIRIVTPNLKTLMNDYRMKKLDRWKHSGWLPETPAQLVNEGLRNWGHLFVYDADELAMSLAFTGFLTTDEKNWGISEYDELNGIETRPQEGRDVILEATK